jgi:peptide/nickel transport system permease protein
VAAAVVATGTPGLGRWKSVRAYIVRRLLLTVPTLLVLSLIIYVLIHLVPGDVIDAMQANSDQALDRRMMEKKLGLDAPLVVQYARWLGVLAQPDGKVSGVLQGDFGISWWTRKGVVGLMLERWPVTIELGFLGLIIAQIIALPIGTVSALRQDKSVDYLGRSLAILLISVPSFWVGTMIVVFPSIWWGTMPPIMYIRLRDDVLGNLGMVIAPAIVLGMGLAGLTMRMTRTMVLEVMRQDYIRTAWAKGLTERTVVLRHTVKNALIPVITIVGLQVPIMVGGTVIIEQIFSLPGMGRLILDAILHRDQPLISGALLIFAVGLVLINLIVDLAYSFLDPRLHYR